jgi:hypothetical protein
LSELTAAGPLVAVTTAPLVVVRGIAVHPAGE